MDIYELLSLKAEYEKDLILAQAKVSVITDIISKVEEKKAETEIQNPEQCDTDEVAHETSETETIY